MIVQRIKSGYGRKCFAVYCVGWVSRRKGRRSAVSIDDCMPGVAVVVLPDHEAVRVSAVTVAVEPHPVLAESVAIQDGVKGRIIYLNHEHIPGWSPGIVESVRNELGECSKIGGRIGGNVVVNGAPDESPVALGDVVSRLPVHS